MLGTHSDSGFRRTFYNPVGVLGAFALILLSATLAAAAPIRTLPDLVSVTIYEATFFTTGNTYAPNSSELTTRLADPLGAANRDFSFVEYEYYDVFYSNANGAFNIDGAFITIEGVWRNLSEPTGGMNINEVELNFSGPTNQFADFVSSFVYGSVCNFGPTDCAAGSEALAVDHGITTFPRFGHTSDTNLNERFRLTVGFDGISPSEVPLPPALLFFASGLAVILGAARRKRVSG